MERVVKILSHPEGKRRVLIVQRSGGHYGHEEERFSDEATEMCWFRFSQVPFSIYDSAETAEREARSRFEWLERGDKGR
jgi:hypothetical protein